MFLESYLYIQQQCGGHMAVCPALMDVLPSTSQGGDEVNGLLRRGVENLNDCILYYRSSLPSFRQVLSPTAVHLALSRPVHQRRGIVTQIAAMSIVSTSAKPLYDL